MWWLWLVACGPTTEAPEPVQVEAEQAWAPAGEAAFVGSGVCADCHAEAYDAWTGSQHQRALLLPDEATGVHLGSTLLHGGGTDRFDPGPPLRFQGSDGEGEVAFWIGVDPIVQALVKGDGGRLQTLDTTWDARPVGEGGQRWLRLHEGLAPTDALHWTGRAFAANHQCLDCHTTGFDKGYEAATDAYDSTWAEKGVGCEGCHGPSSHHVQWAQAEVGGDEAYLTRVYEDRRVFDQAGDDGILRAAGASVSNEPDTCARCHSRRALLASGSTAATPLWDSHRPVWLEQPLYWPDGQIRDEVYVWGSFQQSAMHQAGVTCSNCHDPHTAELRGTPQQVCAQCHEPAVFDGVAHHNHGEGAVQCVDCHMPQTTYMAVDARADHSLRVPRPDLALLTGGPDACSSCHEEGPAWAAEAIARWYPEGQQTQGHWQEVLVKGGLQERLGVAFDPSVPAIVRATLIAQTPELAFNPDPFKRLAADPSPQVRIAAVSVLETIAPERRALGTKLLDDEVAAVRMEAARVLAGTPAMRSPSYARARSEYLASQALHADRAEGNVALAMFKLAEGDGQGALADLQRATKVDPDSPMGWVNLADAWRAMGDETKGQQTLMDAMERPSLAADGTLKHAMGLSLIRQGKHQAALVWLREASELTPGNGRFAYVYAVALDSQGRKAEAKQVLQEAVARMPGDPQLQQALASLGQ